jgi:uncharacterized protein YciI
LAVREQYYDQHVAWLKAHGDVILVAGVFRKTPDAKPSGAIWITNAADRAALEKLIDTDPFWVHGLRQTRDISFFNAHSQLAGWPKL